MVSAVEHRAIDRALPCLFHTTHLHNARQPTVAAQALALPGKMILHTMWANGVAPGSKAEMEEGGGLQMPQLSTWAETYRCTYPALLGRLWTQYWKEPLYRCLASNACRMWRTGHNGSSRCKREMVEFGKQKLGPHEQEGWFSRERQACPARRLQWISGAFGERCCLVGKATIELDKGKGEGASSARSSPNHCLVAGKRPQSDQ